MEYVGFAHSDGRLAALIAVTRGKIDAGQQPVDLGLEPEAQVRSAEIALDNVVDALIVGVTVEKCTVGPRAHYKAIVKNLILIGVLENLFA